MRILVAHNRYQVPGGEDMVAQSEAALLKANGEEVAIYERHNDELNDYSALKKATHIFSLGNNRTSYADFRKVLRQHQTQVAHFHNIFYMMTPAVYQACRDEGVAVVQSLHNFRMMCSNGLFFRDGHVCEDCLSKNIWEGVKHRCFRQSTLMTAAMASTLNSLWQRKVWLKDVDLYIAAAEFTRGKYIQRGIPSDKIILKSHFVPDPSGQRDDKGYALYLGRLSEEKGVRVLLEAWRSLKNVPLKIAGNGPLTDELKKFVQDNNISGVEFLGFVNQEQCADLIRQAKVVLLPSVCYENFPRVIVEAFAAGVPVVASRLGSLAELVQDGVTGLLSDPGNAAELSQKVRWCFDHPNEISDMGQNARRTFVMKYSAQANYTKLIEIYQQAINRSKERAS